MSLQHVGRYHHARSGARRPRQCRVQLDEAGEIYAQVGAGGYLSEVIAKKDILKA